MGVGDRLEFERLGEGNYATWKGDMEAYLRRLTLWRITSGSWLWPAGSMVTPAATSAQVTAGVTPSPVLSPPDLVEWAMPVAGNVRIPGILFCLL